jgi:hypothetical protein
MSDQFSNDLDQARETIDALARHVDTTDAWNAVEAAVERLPRDRARRRMQLAAATVAVVTIAGGLAYALRSGTDRPLVEVTGPSTTTIPTLDDCALPSIPDPFPDSSQSPVEHLGGPAVSALKGGAALAGFELDGGQLSATPPSSGDTPSVSAGQAECAALASISPNGRTLLDLASSYGGVAVGYGRVSVAPELVANAKQGQYLAGQLNDNTKPTLPAAADYLDRLAWIVVVRDFEISHGQTPPTIPASSHSYLVFLLDAQTGSDALLYAERAYGPAAVTVPAERVSGPWTLVSRSPNGYSGEISATVLPGDGYPNPVNVDRDRAALSVIVQRPVNPSCGEPKQVTIPLHAAGVTSDLPDRIDHGPLGPYVTPQSSSAPPPRDDGRVLRSLSGFDNGTTITVTVGSVLAVGPLHVSGKYAADMAASSDPNVLGTLPDWSDYEIGEFRAWHPGHADLFVAGTGCEHTGSNDETCPPTWVVHVNIG